MVAFWQLLLQGLLASRRFLSKRLYAWIDAEARKAISENV
jgi:hypothetical protein